MARHFFWVIALGAPASIGCSGPVGSSPAVGLTINISATGVGCAGSGVATNDDLGNPPPDASTGHSGKRIYDGDSGVSVKCSVKGAGPWSISTRVSSNSPNLTFLIDGGTIGTDGTGTANMSLSTAAINDSLQSPPGSPCTLKAVAANGGIVVRSGAVWAQYTCPDMRYPPSGSCFVAGEFILENCDQ
ncbi:MAG: hypothetical protein QM756_17245 [Polyangiaceae bacterium]